MSDDDDITHWIEGLRGGDGQAAQAIWEAYFDRLVCLARKKMAAFPRRAADEEDVALSALESFHRGVIAGRFPKLDDRHDLWKVLVTITVRKILAQRRRHFAKKRGGGQVRGESVFLAGPDDSQPGAGIGGVLGKEPTPELGAEFAEQCEGLLVRLDDDLRRIALLKMEGHTNQEIADQLDVVLRTVERKLERIRRIWSTEGVAP